MTKFWRTGDIVPLRGIYNKRAWIVQSTIVVKDCKDEVTLALLPGAECMMPEGYINRGLILSEWAEKIDLAKKDILQKIELRQYPLDGKWLNWEPGPQWPVATLPTGWDSVQFTGLEIT